jgi:hypothetical protein
MDLLIASSILKNSILWKLDLIPSLGDRAGKPTLSGQLETANLNQFVLTDPTQYVSAIPSPEDSNRSSFLKVVL